MQLINRFNKGFRFLLCVIDFSCKYAWTVSLKDFQKILKKANRKPNKIWIDK